MSPNAFIKFKFDFTLTLTPLFCAELVRRAWQFMPEAHFVRPAALSLIGILQKGCRNDIFPDKSVGLQGFPITLPKFPII